MAARCHMQVCIITMTMVNCVAKHDRPPPSKQPLLILVVDPAARVLSHTASQQRYLSSWVA